VKLNKTGGGEMTPKGKLSASMTNFKRPGPALVKRSNTAKFKFDNNNKLEIPMA
jgi:hypothetical protein